MDQVVETLKNAARESDFGGFNVDPESIRETGKAVSTTGAQQVPQQVHTHNNAVFKVSFV